MTQQERTEQLNKALEDIKRRFSKFTSTQPVIVPQRIVVNNFQEQIERMPYDRRNI